MRQSHTAVVTRNAAWDGPFATEPWETAWAIEAIYFVRILEPPPLRIVMQYRVEISPDGIHWAELFQGTFAFDEQNPLWYRQLNHFGGWLRLSGKVSYSPEMRRRVIRGLIREPRFMAYLTLKS
ncbi:MAG: hypothetical protein F4Y80_11915 [Caldilineaceae bacterium SB0665_bin_21]|nr:hypothetical protein [Caldilineaceae bacterium SB0665_bin_21]MYA05903.1 hypothetical protein [Caldilineaceae bacterium SB0664_bin_22]MYC62480.1 hypothetical protein [Caldilineaceae bacterium SB0661_bin_34]